MQKQAVSLVIPIKDGMELLSTSILCTSFRDDTKKDSTINIDLTRGEEVSKLCDVYIHCLIIVLIFQKDFPVINVKRETDIPEKDVVSEIPHMEPVKIMLI